MTLLSTLAAVSAFVTPQAAGVQSVHLAGRDVPVTFAALPADTRMPDEYLGWKGWGYLAGAARRPVACYPIGGYTLEQFGGVAPKNPQAVKWHTKIVLMRRVDLIDTSASGILSMRRSSLLDPQIQSVLQAIARFTALVQASSKGMIEIVPDMTIESEEMSDRAQDAYLEARVNGPGFEPDDGIYRGPYQSTDVIDPVKTIEDFQGAGALSMLAVSSNGLLDQQLYQRWLADFVTAAVHKGIPAPASTGSAADTPGAYADEKYWAQIADSATPTAQEVEDALKLTPPAVRPAVRSTLKSYHSENVSVKFADDPAKGKVLHYTETGFARAGGLAAPAGKLDLAATPLLSFWVRGTSREPIAVWLGDPEDRAVEVSIGRDAPTIAVENRPARTKSALIESAFTPDGTWQHVVVDLSKVSLASDADLCIGPSFNDLIAERVQTGPIEFEFADFQFLKAGEASETLLSAPRADFASREPEERILAIKAYEANPTADSKPQALRLLGDSDDNVRLNATVAFGNLKDVDAEPLLAVNAAALDPHLDEAALKALATLGTPSAWTTIRHALLSGTTDLARITAARLLAATKDPNLAGPIADLYANRSWQVRKAAAEAIASIPGPNASMILMEFLLDDDPAVRLAVTKDADTSQEHICNKLLYSSVNDPSDAVRAWSDIRLIQSPIASFREEGYKGVRDDSRRTRLMILGELAKHPSENDRQALRVAVADTDPAVRAAALRAFARIPGSVTLEEIANTLQDAHPWVESALVELAEAKKLSLPKETLAELQGSPDAETAKKARELGG